MVQNVDKNIKDTEALIESFIPNMNRIFQEKRIKENLQKKNKDIEESKLSKIWQGIKDKAMKRGDKDCPICYNPYHTHVEVVLLNCSHMFHKCCLDSFEKFDIAKQLCCPMCRHQNYQKTFVKV